MKRVAPELCRTDCLTVLVQEPTFISLSRCLLCFPELRWDLEIQPFNCSSFWGSAVFVLVPNNFFNILLFDISWLLFRFSCWSRMRKIYSIHPRRQSIPRSFISTFHTKNGINRGRICWQPSYWKILKNSKFQPHLSLLTFFIALVPVQQVVCAWLFLNLGYDVKNIQIHSKISKNICVKNDNNQKMHSAVESFLLVLPVSSDLQDVFLFWHRLPRHM